MKNLIRLFGAGAAVLLTASSASATEFEPSFGVSRAGGFVDLWPAKRSFAEMGGLELQLRVAPKVFLDISATAAYASVNDVIGIKTKRATFGNPTLGVHFVAAASRNFHFFVGGAVTLPMLHDPDEGMADAARFTSRIRGYYDADRLVPGHMALRAAGGFEWRAASPLFLRAELRPVLYVPTTDKYRVFGSSGDATEGRGTVGFALEQAVEAELRFDIGLGVGMRLQGVAPLMEKDQFQALAEPFVSITPPKSGLYARVGLPTALDDELGFGLNEDKLAGVRVAIGGQW
jgi:hypothetical protein